MMKTILSWFLFYVVTCGLCNPVKAQSKPPTQWSYELSKTKYQSGEEIELIFKVKIQAPWYLYSTDFDPDLGPKITSFAFNTHKSYELIGDIQPIKPRKKYDPLWEGEISYFTKTAEFRQKIKVKHSKPQISGTFNFQVCSDEDGKCLNFSQEFNFSDFL
ncbi:protein-disulfide reductase DsbD domain-containing protein [Rapidithrix thailandica]|uniref:Protein-disulfide reductase DsbD domain-containing protein n=1 Tax=Rapidithrix thailandica TaxID=413964 RepID=A0AAW9S938_9BACT